MLSSWLTRVNFTLVSLSHCQIKAEDDQPLPGVLLSLSGGMFRSNLLTQDNGILTFSNLVRCPVTELLPIFPVREQGRGVCDLCVACLTMWEQHTSVERLKLLRGLNVIRMLLSQELNAADSCSFPHALLVFWSPTCHKDNVINDTGHTSSCLRRPFALP